MIFWSAGEVSEDVDVFDAEGSWSKWEDEESAGAASEAGGVAGDVMDAEGEDEEGLFRSGSRIKG